MGERVDRTGRYSNRKADPGPGLLDLLVESYRELGQQIADLLGDDTRASGGPVLTSR